MSAESVAEPDSLRRQGPGTFHVMAKPRGPVCNLNCQYCFYLSKEELYPSSRFQMSEEMLERYVRQHIEAHRVPEVTFTWQGGEPTLMGLDFYRRAVDLQQKFRKPNTRIHNALQSNAVGLNEEWCRFFRQNDFLVGVSLDGPREFHDAYRVDKTGAPTFDRVMAGIRLLQQHRVEFNILASVHQANASRGLEVYHFLRDEVPAQFIQFIPIVEQDLASGVQADDKVTARSISGRQYGEFLIAVFDDWVRRDVGRVFVQVFDVALGVWFGTPSSLCVHAETCGDAVVLEHNGDVYACDHFVDPLHKLGNICEQTLAECVASPRQRQFGRDKLALLPQYCRRCPVRFACQGGCPKDRVLATPDGEPGLNYLCEGLRSFFTHIDRPMRMMAKLLHEKRSPAGIMARLQNR